MYHFSLEAFVCLEVWPLGHDGSILLSIVAQALPYNFFVQVLLLFLVMPMTAVSGNSQFLRTGFHTGAYRRRRVADGGLHL
jgi:hypothetical protein